MLQFSLTEESNRHNYGHTEPSRPLNWQEGVHVPQKRPVTLNTQNLGEFFFAFSQAMAIPMHPSLPPTPFSMYIGGHVAACTPVPPQYLICVSRHYCVMLCRVQIRIGTNHGFRGRERAQQRTKGRRPCSADAHHPDEPRADARHVRSSTDCTGQQPGPHRRHLRKGCVWKNGL